MRQLLKNTVTCFLGRDLARPLSEISKAMNFNQTGNYTFNSSFEGICEYTDSGTCARSVSIVCLEVKESMALQTRRQACLSSVAKSIEKCLK